MIALDVFHSNYTDLRIGSSAAFCSWMVCDFSLFLLDLRQNCRALLLRAHKPSLGCAVQMFGLQQGRKRPVRLLTAASPVQEDLQPPGKQSPQEESTQLLLT